MNSSGVLQKHIDSFIPKVYFAHMVDLPTKREGDVFKKLMTYLEVENDVDECFGKSEQYTGADYEAELENFKKTRMGKCSKKSKK